jgi:hypothetical protein
MKVIRCISVAAAAFLSPALPAAAQDWVSACSEGSRACSIDGTRMVRYGADGVYNYAVATNAFICSAETFGTVAVRGQKSCWYRQTAREQSLEASVSERDRQLRQLRARAGTMEQELSDLRAALDEAYAELDQFYAMEFRGPPPNRGLRWRERPRRQ